MFWKLLIILGLLKTGSKTQTIKVFRERYGNKLSSQEYEDNKNWAIRKLKLKYMVEKDWEESEAELQAIEDFEEAERELQSEKEKIKKMKLDQQQQIEKEIIETERIEKARIEKARIEKEKQSFLICDLCQERDKTVETTTDTISGYDLLMCRSCKEERNEQ